MSDERLIWAGTVSPWRITATPGPDGVWLVRFRKSGMSLDEIDQAAIWGPDGWDARRWWPHGAKVPPALRVHVEAWLRDHPLLRGES